MYIFIKIRFFAWTRSLGVGQSLTAEHQPPVGCRSTPFYDRYESLQVNDMSVKDFIATTSAPVYQPHTAGRYQKKRFRKAQCPIVERCEICTVVKLFDVKCLAY